MHGHLNAKNKDKKRWNLLWLGVDKLEKKRLLNCCDKAELFRHL
jgi:hypothetical protein